MEGKVCKYCKKKLCSVLFEVIINRFTCLKLRIWEAHSKEKFGIWSGILRKLFHLNIKLDNILWEICVTLLGNIHFLSRSVLCLMCYVYPKHHGRKWFVSYMAYNLCWVVQLQAQKYVARTKWKSYFSFKIYTSPYLGCYL